MHKNRRDKLYKICAIFLRFKRSGHYIVGIGIGSDSTFGYYKRCHRNGRDIPKRCRYKCRDKPHCGQNVNKRHSSPITLDETIEGLCSVSSI